MSGAKVGEEGWGMRVGGQRTEEARGARGWRAWGIGRGAVVRSRRKRGLRETAGARSDNNIVEVTQQDMDVSPTETCLALIGMMHASATLSEAILPASLSMLMRSKLYPLLVQYPVEGLPPQSCKKIWVLITAIKIKSH